jgi:hypothetical protein
MARLLDTSKDARGNVAERDELMVNVYIINVDRLKPRSLRNWADCGS